MLSHPNRDNQWVGLALIEGGAVIPGRSIAAWKRDPWEFRERIFDEVVVAAFWLQGFAWMNSLFDQAQKRLPFKSLRHLDTGIDAIAPKNHAPLELTAIERYASRAESALPIVGMRGAKTLFSVVSSGLIIALAIPKINQKLTEWFLLREGQRQERLNARSTEGDPGHGATVEAKNLLLNAGPFGHSPEPGEQLKTHHAASENAGISAGSPFHRFNNASFTNAFSAPRFGGGGEGLVKGIQAFANTMEWVNTSDYGKVLTNDGAMITGRTWSAATRKDTPKDKGRLEALEILLRDVGSNYFYLAAIPHTRWALGKVFKAINGSDILLDPAVATLVNKAVLDHPAIQTARQLQQPITADLLKTVFYGHPVLISQPSLTAGLHQAATHLQPDTQAHKQFWELLQAETGHLLGKQEQAKALSAIQAQLKPDQAVTPDALVKLLSQFNNHPPVSSSFARKNLTLAIKNAYRHAVGGSPTRLLEHPQLKPLLGKLSRLERQAMEHRLNEQAQLGAQDHLGSAFRRIFTLAQEHLDPDHELLKAFDTLLKPLEQAVSQGYPLTHKSHEAEKALQNGFVQLVKKLEGAKLSEAAQTLLARYQEAIGPLQAMVQGKQPGKLFTLHTDPQAVTHWIEGLISGGLKHDPALRNVALNLSGLLPSNLRSYPSASKLAGMQQAIESYWKTIGSQLEKQMAGHSLKPEQLVAALHDLSLWKNMVPRYLSHGAGIAVAMAGLGLLIPKIQYAVTKRITGEYQHPALQSLEKKYGLTVTHGKPHAVEQRPGFVSLSSRSTVPQSPWASSAGGVKLASSSGTIPQGSFRATRLALDPVVPGSATHYNLAQRFTANAEIQPV